MLANCTPEYRAILRGVYRVWLWNTSRASIGRPSGGAMDQKRGRQVSESRRRTRSCRTKEVTSKLTRRGQGSAGELFPVGLGGLKRDGKTAVRAGEDRVLYGANFTAAHLRQGHLEMLREAGDQ